jgi:peptidoglycan hydrolase CwlO-like protein
LGSVESEIDGLQAELEQAISRIEDDLDKLRSTLEPAVDRIDQCEWVMDTLRHDIEVLKRSVPDLVE